jgi:hypothetical protein
MKWITADNINVVLFGLVIVACVFVTAHEVIKLHL